jgi:hypothetical protein
LKRPLGVTLLAVLLLSVSISLFVLAGYAYRHPEILLQLHLIHPSRSATVVVEAEGTFVTFAPIFACILAVLAVNLLFLRSWARWILVISTGIGLFRLVAALVLGFMFGPKNFVLTPLGTIPLALNATIVYYLTRPSVRAAFGEGTDSRIYSE